jgi:tRNA-specific 2-thiouridylase
VLDKALALGFDAVVTGHHARMLDGRLLRSVDPAKDQSYVLAVCTRQQLAHALFPLGDSTKAQVRAEAAERGLAVADKPDSHDICFIADGNTRGFLSGHLGAEQGPIVDAVSGEVVGAHAGSFGYTVGQRRGLNLQRPAADGEPRYVLSIQPKENTVVVGPAQLLDTDLVLAGPVVWTSGAAPGDRFRCEVQLRAHGMTSRATVTVEGDGVRAELARPQRGVAAGQALVMYDGDMVIGSATISAASRTSDTLV